MNFPEYNTLSKNEGIDNILTKVGDIIHLINISILKQTLAC